MGKLKYTIIKSKKQYNEYCKILEDLLCMQSEDVQDEVELLTLLIEKWDEEQNSLVDLNPIELLKALMLENNLRSKDLVEILALSKGTVSKILNYHKGLSKESIRKLAKYFKLSQEAFNRPYPIADQINHTYKSARLVNSKKHLEKSSAVQD